MSKLIRFAQNLEAVGMASGLVMLLAWPLREKMLWTPAWMLFAAVLLASVAGFTVAASASRCWHRIELAIRRGAWAGLSAVIVAGACFALMARTVPGGGAPLRALLIAATSALPAMFAGSIAAGVGAFWFRRREGEPPEPTEMPAELPKSFRWTARGLVGAFVGAALLTPFFPTPSISRDGLAQRQSRYTTPEGLKSAPPIAWRVATTRGLGRFIYQRDIALSKDERFLAGLDGDSSIAVYDLESDGVKRIPAIPYPVRYLAFSPNGERLFVRMDGDPRRIGVADLKSGAFVQLPQPKKHSVPEGKVAWTKENEIIFLENSSNSWRLNLDSLEIDPATLVSSEYYGLLQQLSPGMPDNKQWSFQRGQMLTSAELPETEGVQTWPVANLERMKLADLQRGSLRYFPEIDINERDGFRVVSDGSKLLRFRENTVTAFYFDTRPVPPLRWRIKLPHGPAKMTQSDSAVKALARGDLGLVLYSPLINPLNRQTVGPDRERPKAVLRVERWEDTEADVWIMDDYFPYVTGDVLADFHEVDTAKLLSFDQRQRWWTAEPILLPNASDVAKLPLMSELESRRAKAKEVQEKADKQADEARLAEERKRQTPPSNPIPAVLPQPDSEVMTNAKELEKEVTEFVTAHHEKASKAQIAELVNDYADAVDYLNKGTVNRAFIYKDEVAYHRLYRYVREKVEGKVTIIPLEEGTIEALYTMSNEWQRAADGKTGGKSFSISLRLERWIATWRIVKQRSEPKS